MRWLAQGIPTKDELAEMIAVRCLFALALIFEDGLSWRLTSVMRAPPGYARASFREIWSPEREGDQEEAEARGALEMSWL